MGCIESSDDRPEPFYSGHVDASATTRPSHPPSRPTAPNVGTEIQRTPLVAQEDRSFRQHGKAWRFYVMIQQPNNNNNNNNNNACDSNFGISTSTAASTGGTPSGERTTSASAAASESVGHPLIIAEAAANHPHFLLAESLPGECDASCDSGRDCGGKQQQQDQQQDQQQHRETGVFLKQQRDDSSGLQSPHAAPLLKVATTCDVDGGTLAETPDPPHLSSSFAAHHLAADTTVVPATVPSAGYVCFVSRTLPSDGDFVIRKKAKPLSNAEPQEA